MSVLESNYAEMCCMTNDRGLTVNIYATDEQRSSFNIFMRSLNHEFFRRNVYTYAEALELAFKQLEADL